MSRAASGPRPEAPVALVTGAGSGLGTAVALELDRLGYRVVVHYNTSESGAKDVAGKLVRDHLVVGADVADVDQVRTMFESIDEAFGGVDVVINNAAIRHDGLMAMQSVDAWRQVIETNLLGTFYTCRFAVPHMLRQRWGRIVNVVSPSGIIATPGQTAYGASKSGVIGLTRTLAAECGRRGVTVNALSPGFMETSMTKELSESRRHEMQDRIPLARFTSTEEVAASIGCFLDHPYMTGQVISVDGGVSLL
jgi:3-oxoacyl-[acyl-carrier protein] reductase